MWFVFGLGLWAAHVHLLFDTLGLARIQGDK